MVKQITRERLADAAAAFGTAALETMGKVLKTKDLSPGLVKCEYKGTVQEEEPLRTLTRITFGWEVSGAGFQGRVPQELLVTTALHNKGASLPWELKMPLTVACLPTAIAKRRLVPAMSKHEEVECHALGIAKEHEADLETTFAVRSSRRQEYLKCAHIDGDEWLCHAGGILAITGLVPLDVSEEPQAKSARLNSGPLYRIRTVQKGEQLNKLMAFAEFSAELRRALKKERPVEMATALGKLNTDPFTWGKSPKNVFVAWSYKSPEGSLRYELSEVGYKSLLRAR